MPTPKSGVPSPEALPEDTRLDSGLNSNRPLIDVAEEKEEYPLLRFVGLDARDRLPEPDTSSLPPLSLGPNSKTQRSRAGYGALPVRPSRFGLAASRKLKAASSAMSQTVLPHECLFITGTLPGSTEAAFRNLAAYSAYIVNGLKSWIANYAPQKYDFYVWEYQKRGALHLHYCVHIPDEISRDYIRCNFKEWWCGILHRVGALSNCDMFRKNAKKTHLGNESIVRAEAQIVKKDVGRYLSKYLSKSINPKRGNARFFTPSRWWGVSRPLNQLLESMTDRVELMIGGIHSVLKQFESITHYCYSSDGKTFDYSHKFGIGKTIVNYPETPEENQSLWENIMSHLKGAGHSSLNQRTPSQILREIRNREVRLLEESLTKLPEIWGGLRATLTSHLNMIQTLTPSQSEQPLGIILMWQARISDIRSLLKFSPVDSPVLRRQYQEIQDGIESQIDEIAFNGWR